VRKKPLSRGGRGTVHFSELLEFAVEQVNDGIAVMKFTGGDDVPIRIVYANTAIERLSGYSRDELLDPSNPFLRVQPQNRALYESMFAQVRAGNPVRFEVELGGKDRAVWVEVRWSPLRYASGAVTHYVAVLRDITERRRAQEERDLLYRAIGQADDGITIFELPDNDPRRRHAVYANDAACRMLRLSREEILSRGLAKRFFGNAPELLDRYLVDLMQGVTFKRDLLVTLGDGSRRWIEMTASPFYDENGRIGRVIGTYRDIEERKRNEEQRALLQSILAETTDFIVVADDSRPAAGGPLVTYANPAFAALVQCDHASIAGMPLAGFFSEDNDPKTLANLAEHLESHTSISHELLVRARGGDERWVELTGNRVRGEAGTGGSWLFIGKDISVRKHGYTQTAQLLTALDLAEEPIAIYDVREPLEIEAQHVNERARAQHSPLLERLLGDALQRDRMRAAWPLLAGGRSVRRLVLGESNDMRRWATLEIRPLQSSRGALESLIAIEHVLRIDAYQGLADDVGTALELSRELRTYPHADERRDGFLEVLRHVWEIVPVLSSRDGAPEVALHAGTREGCAIVGRGILHDEPIAVDFSWPQAIGPRRLTALRLFLETFARPD
jgi:PAS domain S-box-containing protein